MVRGRPQPDPDDPDHFSRSSHLASWVGRGFPRLLFSSQIALRSVRKYIILNRGPARQ